jgi:pimeloyl-ACP methyl ester carboxylesterase
MTAPVSRHVRLDTGIDYHVLEWGGQDATRTHSVFLLHGFLDLAWSWEATVRAGLAEGLHLVAPDLRGHGDSDRVGAGAYYHFFDYLGDLHSLVGALARDRLSLVGHSMGGSVASYYAGTFPDRVHRLAMLEGTGPPESPQSPPERVQTWLRGWAKVRKRPARSYPSVAVAAERLQKNDPLLEAEMARFLADKGTDVGADGSRTFKHDPLHLTLGPYPFRVAVAAEFWKRITCPVLLVEAERSNMRHPPDETARRHACFVNARHVLLPNAGHMMLRHQPAKLAGLLREFLTE